MHDEARHPNRLLRFLPAFLLLVLFPVHGSSADREETYFGYTLARSTDPEVARAYEVYERVKAAAASAGRPSEFP